MLVFSWRIPAEVTCELQEWKYLNIEWIFVCVCVNIKSVFVQKSFMEENILKDGKQRGGW